MRRVADRAAAVAFIGKLTRLAVDRDAGEQVFPVAGVIIGERLCHAGASDRADVACCVVGIRALDLIRRLVVPVQVFV